MNPNADMSIKPPFWVETWFYEQLVYVLVCLSPAMLASWQLLAAKGPITTRDTVLLVGTMLGVVLHLQQSRFKMHHFSSSKSESWPVWPGARGFGRHERRSS